MEKHCKSISLIPIILSLILAMVVSLTGCVTMNQPSTSESSQPEQSTSEDGSIPEYHTLSFPLEGKETQEKGGRYSFPIYLCNDETLHFMAITESEYETFRVYLHILTPSRETISSYGIYFPEVLGEYAGGTLCGHAAQSFKYFTTQFSPSDYDWGEGYYRMEFVNESGEPGIVKVEYWIEK